MFHAGAEPKTKNFPIFVHHLIPCSGTPRRILSAKFGDIREATDKMLSAEDSPRFDSELAPKGFVPIVRVFAMSATARLDRREVCTAALMAWIDGVVTGLPDLSPPASDDLSDNDNDGKEADSGSNGAVLEAKENVGAAATGERSPVREEGEERLDTRTATEWMSSVLAGAEEDVAQMQEMVGSATPETDARDQVDAIRGMIESEPYPVPPIPEPQSSDKLMEAFNRVLKRKGGEEPQ